MAEEKSGGQVKEGEEKKEMLKAGNEMVEGTTSTAVVPPIVIPNVPKPKNWGQDEMVAHLKGAVRFLASKLGDQALKELKELFPALGD